MQHRLVVGTSVSGQTISSVLFLGCMTFKGGPDR